MKKAILILFVALSASCNTKLGTNEPTVDSKANPAEMPVDSVGASTDVTESAATDSNKTADPGVPPGKSDLQTGGQEQGSNVISPDGNVVGGDSTGKTLPAKNR